VLLTNGSNNSWWATFSDFAMNEGLLGFDYHREYQPRRLAGRISAVQRPAETMLFCDAKLSKLPPLTPFNLQCPWIMMAPALSSTGPVTMADVLAQNAQVEPYRAEIDTRRHKGKMNICFADGHVEFITIGTGELERIYLLAK
jgi:prepilin-type processing-associated H-X9-DG protein